MGGEDRAEQLQLRLPTPLAPLYDERLQRRRVQLWLKRDDLIHPEIPGNKWRKLKHNLMAAVAQGQHTLLTFGGAYSNHIRATAAAGYYFGFNSIGVIRGEEHLPLNPSLSYAVSRGMRLTYLDRTAYRAKHEDRSVADLRRAWGRFYLLPEGGSNAMAARGCRELAAEIGDDFDILCCPVGTGGTLAGLAAGVSPERLVIGFSALKGGEFLARDVARLQTDAFGKPTENWRIESRFHFGGFAKNPLELRDFVRDFALRHGVLLERIYVAKMMYGIVELVESGAFPAGTRIVAVITGGAD